MSFKDMKNNRKSLYEKLREETEKVSNGGGGQGDDRYWRPTVDKAGNGSAIIRFLPSPEGEDLPWVRMFSHGFQGPGGWYIENSLTTIGKDDPCSEYNSQLWNRGDDEGKELARKQKRRLSYISNILVVKDPGNPENEGQVKLFKYGKKIFDKINDVMHPEFDDEDQMNPFDLWEGSNFRLKIRQVDGFRNYDKSDFDNPSAVSDDDDELEAMWKKEFSLQEFLDAKNFKSYPELKARLHRVLGIEGSDREESVPEENSTPTPPKPQTGVSSGATAESEDPGSSDDDIDFFKNLVDDD